MSLYVPSECSDKWIAHDTIYYCFVIILDSGEQTLSLSQLTSLCWAGCLAWERCDIPDIIDLFMPEHFKTYIIHYTHSAWAFLNNDTLHWTQLFAPREYKQKCHYSTSWQTINSIYICALSHCSLRSGDSCHTRRLLLAPEPSLRYTLRHLRRSLLSKLYIDSR